MQDQLTMETLSRGDLEFIEGAIRYDIERLETLIRRSRETWNAVRSDEGQAAIRVHIARYKEIIEKIRNS